MAAIAPYVGGPLMAMMLNNVASHNPANFTEVIHNVARSVPGFHEAQALTTRYLSLDVVYVLFGLLVLNCLSQILTRAYKFTDRVLVEWFMTDVQLPNGNHLQRDVTHWVVAHSASHWRGQSLYVDEHDGKRGKRAATTSEWLFGSTPKVSNVNAPPDLVPAVCRQYIFPLGWRPFIYEAKDMGQRSSVISSGHIVIRCFGFSKKPLLDFFEMCVKFAKDSHLGSTPVTTAHGTKYVPKRRMSTVELDDDVRDDILKQLTKFFDKNTVNFYRSVGIPFRLGYLFYGLPGTGKSSLSLALAGRFDVELISINLGDPMVNDYELSKRLSAAPSRCIVFLEDIDSAGIGRELQDNDENKNKNKNQKRSAVTLSGLLNALDGVAAEEGCLIILTSNNPESLDSALIRPGRIDRRIYLPPMSTTNVHRYFKRFYSQCDLLSEELEQAADQFSSKVPDRTITPAELQTFLLGHFENPEGAIAGASTWSSGVVEDRKMRAIESGKTGNGNEDDNGQAEQFRSLLRASNTLRDYGADFF